MAREKIVRITDFKRKKPVSTSNFDAGAIGPETSGLVPFPQIKSNRLEGSIGGQDLGRLMDQFNSTFGASPEQEQDPVKIALLTLRDQLEESSRIRDQQRRTSEVISAVQAAFVTALENHGADDLNDFTGTNPLVAKLRNDAVSALVGLLGNRAPSYFENWTLFYKAAKNQKVVKFPTQE